MNKTSDELEISLHCSWNSVHTFKNCNSSV